MKRAKKLTISEYELPIVIQKEQGGDLLHAAAYGTTVMLKEKQSKKLSMKYLL